MGFVGSAGVYRIAQGYHSSVDKYNDIYVKDVQGYSLLSCMYLSRPVSMRAIHNQFGIAVFRNVALHRPEGIDIPLRKGH